MNSDKIKEIWKSNIVEQIDNYSDAEIEAIILKNARKSIGLSFPGVRDVFLSVGFVLFCIGSWVVFKYVPGIFTYWMSATVIMLAGIGIGLFNRRKMRKYSYDMPLKEWLEKRITYFDESINRKKRSWYALPMAIGFLMLVLLLLIFKWTVDASWKSVFIAFCVGFIVSNIFGALGLRITRKRYIKTRKELQELYKQLDE